MILSVLLCALLAAPPLRAEEPPMTWEDAVATALRINPDLASALLARESQRAAYYGSFNNFMPQFTLADSLNDFNGSTGISRWQLTGTATMSFFDLGRVATIRSNAALLDRAAEQARLASSAQRFNLRQAFVQLLQSQEAVGVARRVVDIRQHGAQMVSLRYDAGRESKGNMLRAQAQQEQAEADLDQTSRDLRTSRRTLGRELGFDRFSAMVATGTLNAVPPPPLPDDEEPILARRPDVASQEATVRSAEAALLSARSTYFPTLSGKYQRLVTGPDEFPSSSYGWTAAATLSLPIFGGGPTATYYASKSSRLALESARQTLRATRADALVNLENAWSDYQRTAAQAKVQADLLVAARQRANEADVRYASGLLSYDNWEIITTDRVTQERLALQARFNASVSQASWERALGQGLGE